jgi:Ca-activated chloride channel family protein
VIIDFSAMNGILRIWLLIFLSWIFSHGGSVHAQRTLSQEPQLTRILFLYDASQSMYGQWQSGTKMDVAKKLLSELVDSLRRTH